jgi:cell division protein FtsZ
MGIGSARGDDRAVAAAEMAISSPLLEASIDGARGVLLSISGGSDLGLFEINEAAQLVSEAAHPEANIIFGAVIDDALGDEVRVTVIAAGFDGGQPPSRSREKTLGGYGAKDETAASPSSLGQTHVPAESPGESERSSFGSLGTLPSRPASDFGADRDRDGATTGAAQPAADPVGEPKPSAPQVPSARPYDGGQVEELDVPDFLK